LLRIVEPDTEGVAFAVVVDSWLLHQPSVLAGSSVGSQPVVQLFGGQFDVAEDLAEQPGADVAPLVDGNRGPAPVGVPELPMASFSLSEQSKPRGSRGADQLARFRDRNRGGAHPEPSTRRTPMISACFGMLCFLALRSSTHRAITSLMFSITSS